MDAAGITSDNDWAAADADTSNNGAIHYIASWSQQTETVSPTALGSIAMKWAALHQAGQVVATIADVDHQSPNLEVRTFPAIMREVGGWRRRLAEQGIDDLTAIMEPGLSALLAALDRGTDPRAAARSLWDEFTAARDALVALAPHNISQLTATQQQSA